MLERNSIGSRRLSGEPAGFPACAGMSGRKKNRKPRHNGRGFHCLKRRYEQRRPQKLRSDYNCPYLRNTARQSLPTRQLCAASTAPQRNRFVQVIPSERSHNRAAAGRHGASSARSIAFAAVPENATSGPINKHAARIVFILNRPSLFVRSGVNSGFMTKMPAFLCVAQTRVNWLKWQVN